MSILNKPPKQTAPTIANGTDILIKSSARLHMGFFDLHGGLGRKFGSIGLSLEAPSLALTASSSEKLHISGASSERALMIVEQLKARLNLKDEFSINIQQHIPEHAGLGSGTQLALMVGTAISQLYHLNLTTAEIAALTGRGNRSGIGIAAFDFGGLLIDGGRSLKKRVPPLLARYVFPEAWRVLLILDSTQPGIHGEEEQDAFSNLPVFSENLAAHLCRCVLMQAMPAIVEQDLTAFGNGIQALQAHVGDYFAPAQGGRYASRQVGTVLEYLESAGVACFGQSSWGPTGFAVFEDEVSANAMLQQLKVQFVDNDNISYQVVRGKNTGAAIVKS